MPPAVPEQDVGGGLSRERPKRQMDDKGGRRGSRRRSGGGRDEHTGAAQNGTPKAGTEAQAKDVCLRLLTDRARSRAELADKLAAKGFAPEVAERALNRLAEVGLIDDAAFAEQWVHSRHTFSGKGKKVLAQELRRKGVSDADADPALAAITPADESARAAELVRRKLSTLPCDLTPDKATARLVGMLARRGFPRSMAYAVVKDELAAMPDHVPEPPHDGGPPSHATDTEVTPLGARSAGGNPGSGAGTATTAPETESRTAATRRASRPPALGVAPEPRTGAVAEPDAERAAELVRRKLRTMPRNLSSDKVINRLVGMLARRGYGQSLAYSVVRAELAHGYPPD